MFLSRLIKVIIDIDQLAISFNWRNELSTEEIKASKNASDIPNLALVDNVETNEESHHWAYHSWNTQDEDSLSWKYRLKFL